MLGLPWFRKEARPFYMALSLNAAAKDQKFFCKQKSGNFCRKDTFIPIRFKSKNFYLGL